MTELPSKAAQSAYKEGTFVKRADLSSVEIQRFLSMFTGMVRANLETLLVTDGNRGARYMHDSVSYRANMVLKHRPFDGKYYRVIRENDGHGSVWEVVPRATDPSKNAVSEYLGKDFPFEERCAAAKVILVFALNSINEATQLLFDQLQAAETKHAEHLSQHDKPEILALLTEWHGRDQERRSSTESLGVVWTHAIDLTQTLWGRDAVDFALAALKEERKPS